MYTNLQVLSMSAPYESANPISLNQILRVQVNMLGRGYSTIVWKYKIILLVELEHMYQLC